MRRVIVLSALWLAACATPSDVIKQGLSRSFKSSRGVPETVDCVRSHAVDLRSPRAAKFGPSATPGGVEVYLDSDLGVIMVAVITPAQTGSNVTVYYESDRMRSLYGDDMVRGCER